MRWLFIVLAAGLAGCATAPTYNPMQVAAQQEILLNENGFKAVHEGMTQDEVHQAMGQEILVGYQFESPTYKPLSIPNPYKTEDLKGTGYTVEYYVEAIRQPDGTISDNELMPLVFNNGKLVGRGWPLANSLKR